MNPVTPVTDDTLPVTLVTKDASQDAPDEFYMEGLQDLWRNGTPEVPGPLDYPKLLALLGEPMSRKAWWHHRINRNRTTFGSEDRNKLRTAIDGVGPIRPPVTDVTAKLIHPDAEMCLIGELPEGEHVTRVMMIADNREMVIHLNGTITAKLVQADLRPLSSNLASSQGEATESPKKRNYTRNTRNHVPSYRPVLSLSLKERVQASGASVEDLIEAGLKALAQ